MTKQIKTKNNPFINSSNNKSIASTLVPGKNIHSFLAGQLGLKAVMFERNLYSWCKKLCPDFNGNHWRLYCLNNGGFFMAPDAKACISFNGYTGSFDAETVGVIVSLFTLKSLAFAGQTNSTVFSDKYFLLTDFADIHPNSSDIFTAIELFKI